MTNENQNTNTEYQNPGHVDFGKNSLVRKLGEINYLDIFRRISNTICYIISIIFNLTVYKKQKDDKENGPVYLETEEFFTVGNDENIYQSGLWIFPFYPENSLLTIIILLVVIFVF